MSVEELSLRVVKMEKVAKSLGVKLSPNTKWVELALAVILALTFCIGRMEMMRVCCLHSLKFR